MRRSLITNDESKIWVVVVAVYFGFEQTHSRKTILILEGIDDPERIPHVIMHVDIIVLKYQHMTMKGFSYTQDRKSSNLWLPYKILNHSNILNQLSLMVDS